MLIEKHGVQNPVEGFNALWQAKVWQRHHCRNVAALERVSASYIAAHRAKTAARREGAPRDAASLLASHSTCERH